MISRLITRLQAFGVRLGFNRDAYLLALGAAIGAVTALGAILFVELIHIAEESVHRLSAETGWWIIMVMPLAGALITGVLIHLFASEARGHGVPEVMDALYRRGGQIRPRVAVVKSLASACTIGSGGSAGAEGPIVQIGSAIGSGAAQILGLSREQTRTLLGCGAAAGIASVFNAPIAGVFFVLEIMLRDFSLRTFTPIVIASVFSTAVTQAVLGQNEAIFAAPTQLRDYVFTLPEMPSYLALGLVCGVVAWAFIRMLYASEDLADRVRLHPIIKPVLGALLLGVLGLAFVLLIPDSNGRPPFFGNGYDTIRRLLDPLGYAAGVSAPVANSGAQALLEPGEATIPTAIWVLALLVFCKAVATCFTLGSGGSGGVFAPSLFLGATTGAAFGSALEAVGLLPDGGSPASYALVGMAAVVAGTTHAPLTAILIIFEITRDVYVLLPIMVAAVLAVVVAQLLMRDSIYTLKLRRRGLLIGSSADLTMLRRLTASEVPLAPHVSVRLEDPVTKLLELNRDYQVADFVVVDDEGRYEGLITSQDVRTALLEREAIPLLLVEDLVLKDLPVVDPDETLDTVMDKFSRHEVSSLAVLRGGATGDRHVEGLITRARLMRRYHQLLRET